MTPQELDRIRSWDKRCGDNEGTFFPVTIDRRRLLEYVDELRAEVALLTDRGQSFNKERMSSPEPRVAADVGDDSILPPDEQTRC
jgi:hypothetical protein